MLIRRILCWFGFHGVRVVDKYYSRVAYRIKCVECGKREVMHDGFQACLPWDSSFDEFYDKLGSFGGDPAAVEK